MFLRHLEKEESSDLQALKRKLASLSLDLDRSLELLGLDRMHLEALMNDPSLLSGEDSIALNDQLKSYRTELDQLCFGNSPHQIDQRREELRKQGQQLGLHFH